jgi:hypothetical protein
MIYISSLDLNFFFTDKTCGLQSLARMLGLVIPNSIDLDLGIKDEAHRFSIF